MATLSNAELTALNTGVFSNAGVAIPGTNHGTDLYKAACWSWALTGQLTAADDDSGPPKLYGVGGVLVHDPRNPGRITGVNNAKVTSLKDIYGEPIETEATIIEVALSVINNAGSSADDVRNHKGYLITSMMKILARANGLEPSANEVANPNYALHMVYQDSQWYSWNHWAISVLRAPGQRHWIQTEPDLSIFKRTDRMWEENRPGYSMATVQLDSILVQHKEVLLR